MDIKQLLTDFGVTDVDGFLSKMKENKIFVSSEENIDVRYDKLKSQHDSATEELKKANELIEDLKKNGGEDLAVKIKEYETKVEQLQSDLQKTKIESAAKLALANEKVVDPDYLYYKLTADYALELDEHGKIKDIENKITELKTKFPTQFSTTQQKHVDPKKLEKPNEDPNTVTKEQFGKMNYQERAKLYQEQPELYAQLTGNETQEK